MVTGPFGFSGSHPEHLVAQSTGLGTGRLAAGLASAHTAVGSGLRFCLTSPASHGGGDTDLRGAVERNKESVRIMCLLPSFSPRALQGSVQMFICCLQMISLVRIPPIFCAVSLLLRFARPVHILFPDQYCQRFVCLVSLRFCLSFFSFFFSTSLSLPFPLLSLLCGVSGWLSCSAINLLS